MIGYSFDHYQKFAAEVVQVTTNVLTSSKPGTDPAMILRWILTKTPGGDVWLFAELDDQRIPKFEPYQAATHRLSSSLKGIPVLVSNHTGLRLAFLLSPMRELPKMIPLPEFSRPGHVLIGQTASGALAGGKWGDMRHMIVVGYTGSGKSITSRSIVYQAIKQEFKLILADLDGTTFPMLADHPALMVPLAQRPEEFVYVLQKALAELEMRSLLYRRASNYPENIESYNEWAQANDQKPLKRVLVALDEFNSAVTKTGGPKGQLGELTTELASRGRKFGMTLLMSAQDFSKDVIGAVRDEVGVIVAHKVNSEAVARNVGVAAAARISEKTPGRAITNRWGQIQAFYLDKSILIRNISAPEVIPVYERELAERAIRETGGRVSRAVLEGWGIGQGEVRRIQEGWKSRGWAENDPKQANGLYITAKMRDLLTNLPALPAPTNPPAALPTAPTSLPA